MAEDTSELFTQYDYKSQPVLCEGKIPEGFGAQSGSKTLKVALAMREAVSNAANFGAKNWLAFIAKDHCAHHHLIFLHDGEAFDNFDSIVTKGVMPLSSGNRGSAFNGQGLNAAAGLLADSDQRINVFSLVRDTNNWRSASGHLDSSRGRTWVASDSTQEIISFLREILADRLDEFKVGYMWRLTIPTRSGHRKRLLETDVSIFGTCIAPELYETMNGEFLEGIINPEEPDEDPKRLKFRSVTAYQKETKGGSSARPSTSFSEYLDRYMTKASPWEIYSPEFDVLLNSDTNRKLVGVKARLRFFVFEGNRGISDSMWLANVRCGITSKGQSNAKNRNELDRWAKEWIPKRKKYESEIQAGNKEAKSPHVPPGFFGIGGGSAPGAVPLLTGFLTLPLVANSPSLTAENKRQLSRFATNAVAFRNANAIMGKLSMPHNSNLNAFVFAYIDIIDCKGTVSDEDDLKNFDPIEFLLSVSQKPDFTIGEVFADRFIDAACAALEDKIPADLIEYLNKLFPANMHDCTPLGADMDMTSGKRDSTKRFEIYDLFNEGKVITPSGRKNGGNLKLGNKLLVAIWDKQDRKFVSAEELSWKTGYTRGVASPMCGKSAVEVCENAAEVLTALAVKCGVADQDYDVPPILISIPDKITTINSEGVVVKTKPSEYVHGLSLPSRNIRANCRGEDIFFGAISEIPAQEHIPNDAPGAHAEGAGNRKSGENLDEKMRRNTMSYHQPRHADAYVTYIGGAKKDLLKINPDNPIIRNFYMQQDVPGSLSTKILNDIFFAMWSIAKGIYFSLDERTSDVRATINPPETEEHVWNDGPDFVINQAIGKFLTDNRLVRSQLDEVESHRAKMANRKVAEQESILV